MSYGGTTAVRVPPLLDGYALTICSAAFNDWARKVVTLGFGSGFTWFGWMTAFYSLVGVISYLYGLALGLGAIEGTAELVFLIVLLGLTAASLLVGAWWFVRGEGEKRLRSILEDL